MANRPFLAMYTLDYIRDTEDLNLEENGAYLLLLFSYWNRQEPLPNDDKKLSKILRISEREWRKVKPSVMRFFRVEGDLIINDRMNYEIDRANEKSQKAAESARSRWPKPINDSTSVPDAFALRSDMPTVSSSPSPSPLSIQTKEKARPTFNENDPPFIMAKLLYTEHLKWQPDFLGKNGIEKTLQTWASDIDKIVRIDGRDIESVKRAIEYAQSDGFWQARILCGSKLREKMDMLLSQLVGNKFKPKREEPAAGKYDPTKPGASVRKI